MRWASNSDLYIIHSIYNKYECISCSLTDNKTYCCDNINEMLYHILNHTIKGHNVSSHGILRMFDEIDNFKKTWDSRLIGPYKNKFINLKELYMRTSNQLNKSNYN